MKQQITLKKLAEQLDLSIGTISKALNNSPEISEKTKSRVKELAKLNQYVPNSFAQGLKSKKTYTIGVIVPRILPNFFSMVLDGIEEKASEMGYKIIICISKESLIKEKQAIEMLVSSQVDGILISPSRETQSLLNTEHLEFSIRCGVPILMFDRLIDGIKADKVSIDDRLEAELATMELLRTGRRKIAYISGIWNTSVNENRMNGYKEALKAENLSHRILEVDCENYPTSVLEKFLQEVEIDAILASDELTTVLTARNILKCGLKIPQDIALIGFTNGKMGELFIPSLTTIDQKAREQGKTAIEVLIDRIEGKLSPEPVSITLKAELINRESTKMAMREQLSLR